MSAPIVSSMLPQLAIATGMVFVTMMIHLAGVTTLARLLREIWLYTGLYLYLGAVADLEAAVYFSTMTYAAIGFGDSEMARQWRLVSAIEGVNGVLLLG